VFVNITDMDEWKRKHRVKPDQRVFITRGGDYVDIKEALLSRGWIENKDHISKCFDLKFSIKAKDCPSSGGKSLLKEN
jgi:hypothetical protein